MADSTKNKIPEKYLDDASLLAMLMETPLFAGMSGTDIAAILNHSKRVEAKRAGFFFRQSDVALRVFVLIEGKVRIVQDAPDGQQVFMRLISPGQMFGWFSALGLGELRFPVSAQAERRSTALAWRSEDLKELMITYPRLAVNALEIMSKRTHDIQARYQEALTQRVESRIACALLRLVYQAGKKLEDGGILIDLELSRQDLAEMAGTTLFTASRTLSAWAQKGIVIPRRKQIVVMKPEALAALAEAQPPSDRVNGA